MAISVVAMTVAHAAEVLHIYQAGIDTGHATFETTAPIWPVFDTDFLDEHRFVAVRDAGACRRLGRRGSRVVPVRGNTRTPGPTWRWSGS
jgi:L-amino acid N-acyltransferase YncA